MSEYDIFQNEFWVEMEERNSEWNRYIREYKEEVD
jgi:hypothetical protein